jgi:hypothetical protein
MSAGKEVGHGMPEHDLDVILNDIYASYGDKPMSFLDDEPEPPELSGVSECPRKVLAKNDELQKQLQQDLQEAERRGARDDAEAARMALSALNTIKREIRVTRV